MRRNEQIGSVSCMLALLCCVAACKTRGNAQPSDPMATAPEPAPPVAAAGNWTVTCQSAEVDTDTATYTLSVQGAVSETDEGQDILVSVTKAAGDKTEPVSTNEQGHGALALRGQVFLGFMSGVLTAAPQSSEGKFTHTGVLTLAKDPNVEGLRVGCTTAKSQATPRL